MKTYEPKTCEHLPTRLKALQYDGTQECADAIIAWVGEENAWMDALMGLCLRARAGHHPRTVDPGDFVHKHPNAKRPYCVEEDAFEHCWRVVG